MLELITASFLSNRKNLMSTQTKFVVYDPETFDKSRIVINDPKTAEFNINDMPISTTTSEGRYIDDEGNECELYIPAPPQSSFGVNYLHDISVPKDSQTPENAKGLQICYQATSLKTMDKPTPAENTFMEIMDVLWELAVEKGKLEAERDEPLVPAPSVSSCMAAEKRKNMALFVKPPLEYPKSAKDKKAFDKTKPKRCYVKLVTTGKGATLKALTRFYGPGDKQVSPLRYIDVRGIITPCFKWEGVFWGSHGPNSPHGASLRFKLVEANFEPTANASLPNHRMLPRNTAVASEDDTDFQSEPNANGASDGFEEPSDEPQPRAALASANKPRPLVKAPVVTRPAAKAPVRPAANVQAKPAAPKAVAKLPVRKPTAPVPVAKPKPVIRKAPPPPVEEEEDVEEVVDDAEESEDE